MPQHPIQDWLSQRGQRLRLYRIEEQILIFVPSSVLAWCGDVKPHPQFPNASPPVLHDPSSHQPFTPLAAIDDHVAGVAYEH